MQPIGRRIREERHKRNLTLGQLAESTDLSKSFLSQIERGLAQPSITSLKKIAQKFEISMVSLFGTDPSSDGFHLAGPAGSPNGATNGAGETYVQDVRVVRETQRKKLSLPGSHVVYEMLTPDLKRRMQILLLQLEPGDSTGEAPIVDPKGEKCLVLLKGCIEYRLGGETYTLHAGDSIYFPADLPQSWKGIGEEPIEAILVMTPPWF